MKTSSATGYQRRCKTCFAAWYQAMKKTPKYQKRLVRDRQHQATPAYKDRQRRSRFLREYGLTLEEYERRVIEQRGCCYICGDETTLVVDHDHKTGEVRKLLCALCNSALGMFREDPRVLQAAIEYVLSFQKTSLSSV